LLKSIYFVSSIIRISADIIFRVVSAYTCAMFFLKTLT